MKRTIYAIYDRAAQDIFGPLQYHAHQAPATRSFTDVVLMPNSQLAQHPEDFCLMALGEIETDENGHGKVTVTGNPRIAVEAADVIQMAKARAEMMGEQ